MVGGGGEWSASVDYHTGGTWHRNLKWKPSSDNTIDFLVEIVKEVEEDKDKIGYLPTSEGVERYKTLILKTGFNSAHHESINICRLLMEGDEALKHAEHNRYVAREFQPTHPEDKKTYLANIPLTRDSRGAERILCVKTGDEIEDNTIVEMSYDSSRKHGWRWVPRNVRWDKTDQLRSGASQYGNDYSVAHDIWKGYHNPITTGMISGRDTVPNREEEDTDIMPV